MERSTSLHDLINWKIRPMTEADLKYVETFPEIPYSRTLLQTWLQTDMNNPNIYCRVLEFNGFPCGACVGDLQVQVFSDDLVARICFVYVHPDFRFGMDPSTQLLTDFEDWARSKNAKATLFTHTNTRLAQRLGYRVSETIHRKELV